MEYAEVVIIGSGPAAYTAALFMRSHQPILFEGDISSEIGPGGQLTTTTAVDNYPGFPKGTQGPELMDEMRKQAMEAGIKVVSRMVQELRQGNPNFVLVTKDKEYEAKSVIIASGAAAKRLYVPGTHDNEFWQKGISACAVCDGFVFHDQRVAVIGGGDSAMEEALYLSNVARKVYLIHRRPGFRAREDKLAKLRGTENIEVLVPYELVSAHGGDNLTHIKLVNNDTKEISDLELEGLFFGIGHVPNVGFLGGLLDLTENGYLKTDKAMRTSVPGVFACGDVQDYYYRQAVTAAASGSVAAKSCSEYLRNLKE